ncbi:MAG: hypothetical protein CMF36_05915 [Leeuwenhoekiella sp.]|nr:hypothetical protein [Leeuwenhoekiella sp.]MBA80651.1 hypothetical protein [Leeuwenhoekiella sp.]
MVDLVLKSEEYVTKLMEESSLPPLAFHNLWHTKLVVEGALELGNSENLSPIELQILLIAAWFHDAGYLESYVEHEEKSVVIAQNFLIKEQAEKTILEGVARLIRATKEGVIPVDILGCIIRDADVFHLSRENYFDFEKKLRLEYAELRNKTFSDLEWNRKNREFLVRHNFYTAYAQANFAERKEILIKQIDKKIKKLEKELDRKLLEDLSITTEDLKALKKKLLKADERPEKGIETMFRLTSKNHIDISGMADSKANIMISINTIIISVLLGSLMQKLDNNPHLIPPTILLLIVNLSSIVYSILSLRPTISSGTFSRADIEKQKVNLLFFGNFYKMNREDYHWGMNRLMENKSFLYSNLIDDIFFLGVVLAKKYDYLRKAYNLFMYGIILSVVAFVLAILFFDTQIS